MKRSAQIGLVVMGALGLTAAGGYQLLKSDEACRSPPGRPADQDCRRSGTSHSGSGSGFGRTGSSSSPPSSTSTSHPAGAQHGGFGSTGHGIGSHGSAAS
jgi:hypothetical protein